MSIDKQYIEFKCIEAIQPIGMMYVGVMNSEDVEKITFVDVRRLREGSDNREVEDYIGIQRKLDPKRGKEIGQYVNLVDATFPNSIILAISSDYVTYDLDNGLMKIEFRDDIAKVLDGQHRIAGFQYYNKGIGSFQLSVSIYLDMDTEDQAIVFATINREQKSVSNSLVADLFAFAKTRSPQKTGHNIARALNFKEGSPFFNKIKILGTANSATQTITQDTFVKSLLKYITRNKQADRDFYKRNKDNAKEKLPYVKGKEQQSLFLRNMFIDDNNDIQIAQLIWNYFSTVRQKWPNAWDDTTNNSILNKSTGFIALMRFFKDVYLHFDKLGEVISKEEFTQIFEKIHIDESDFVKEVYIPGSSGQGQLYRDLLKNSFMNDTNNDPF